MKRRRRFRSTGVWSDPDVARAHHVGATASAEWTLALAEALRHEGAVAPRPLRRVPSARRVLQPKLPLGDESPS
jgi:hypothetical protein